MSEMCIYRIYYRAADVPDAKWYPLCVGHSRHPEQWTDEKEAIAAFDRKVADEQADREKNAATDPNDYLVSIIPFVPAAFKLVKIPLFVVKGFD